MRKLIAPLLLFAAGIAGCSSDQSGPDPSAISGDETFLELIDDARIAVRDGNLAGAGRLYDEALAIDRENAGLWVDIARLRFRGGEHLTAIEAADYALELDPDYAPALLLRAQMVRDAHGLDQSLVWFEAAISVAPRNAEFLAEYAATLGDLGRYKQMLAAVRELAEIDPAHPQVHFLQAVLAARADDPVLARTLLNRSGLTTEGIASAQLLDALIHLQQGNNATASDILEGLVERHASNARLEILYARALWLGGRDADLVERFANRAEANSASPYLVMLVGRSLERMGERERAIPFIERAFRQDTNDRFVLAGPNSSNDGVFARVAEMREFTASGDAQSALSIATSLLSLFPGSADIHALAGDAAMALGDAEAALANYAVAAQVRRSWPLTRKAIEAYDIVGEDAAAETLLARYVAGDPQNISALLLLARKSAERQDWLRVAVLLDTAIALGGANDLEVLTLRVRAADNLGDEGDAARFRTHYSDLKPGDFVRER